MFELISEQTEHGTRPVLVVRAGPLLTLFDQAEPVLSALAGAAGVNPAAVGLARWLLRALAA